jgi:predicted RND superfamily exporter protein
MRLDRYIDLVLRRRWLVVGVALAIILILASGAPGITVTNDYRNLFSEDNPQLQAFDALGNTYASSNTALIAVAPRDGSVFTREVLGAIEELTEAAWRTPHSIRVDSLTNYTHSEAFEDDLVVGPLVRRADGLSDEDLARTEEIALNAIDLAGRLVSRDGSVAGLAINFALPEDRDAAVAEINDHLRVLLADARAAHPNLDYYLTGDVVMHRVFGEATEEEARTLVPLVFVIITVAAAVLLRSVLGTLALVISLSFTVNTTMGFAGWIGTVLNPANSGIPVIVMTVAVANSIHIVTGVLDGMARGLGRNEAVAESLRSNLWPVFLASATTAIGFLSLNASDSPPFRVLGNLVAFGVLCAFLYSATVLPALLSILPLKARRIHGDGPRFFERFGDFVVARRKFLLLSVGLIAAVLVSGIPRIDLTDNWTRYFDERYEFRRDTDFVIDNLTGMETLEFSLESGREGGITDPEYLRAVDAFAEWCRAQPEVAHVFAISDIMKRLNKNLHGDDPAFYRLPDDSDLAAQYLLLYEFSLPVGRDLNNLIDVERSATRVTVVLRSLSTKEKIALDHRAQAWFRQNAPGLETGATGVAVVGASSIQRNIEGMLLGTAVAMAIVSLLLLFVFRSVRLGLISLIPNFVPAAMAMGLWGYAVGEVGVAASVVTAIAFGIIVDDTIHFMTKYVRGRQNGLLPSESVQSAFRSVGRALLVTTVVFGLGFMVFGASGMTTNQALGLLVGMTVIIALLADFLFLPPLLMALDGTRETSQEIRERLRRSM